jgi:hypothetical protein
MIILVAVLTVLGVGVFFLRQAQLEFRTNRDQVEEFMPTLDVLFRTGESFTHIDAMFASPQSGTILIDGCVESAEDLDELKCRIEALEPPRPILWSVELCPPADRKP